MEITVNFEGIDLGDPKTRPEGGIWDNYQTKIAGINFNVKPEECSQYVSTVGYCRYNTDSKEHPEAVRIEDMSHRLLGFIPKDELKEYKKWAEGKTFPCVIGVHPFLAEDNRLRLDGYVTVIMAYDEEELAAQVQHYAKRYYDIGMEKAKELQQQVEAAKKKNGSGCSTLILAIIILGAILQVLCK